jgi:hypothetical protein
MGTGTAPAETLTALAAELDEDPEEFLRLAGRVMVQPGAPAWLQITLTAPELEALLERAAETGARRALSATAGRLRRDS